MPKIVLTEKFDDHSTERKKTAIKKKIVHSLLIFLYKFFKWKRKLINNSNEREETLKKSCNRCIIYSRQLSSISIINIVKIYGADANIEHISTVFKATFPLLPASCFLSLFSQSSLLPLHLLLTERHKTTVNLLVFNITEEQIHYA